MASQKEHEEDCRRKLGEPFSAVHEWLDALQAEYGPMHRVFRHNLEGVEQVRALFGDAAARAAEIHIRRDTGGQMLSAKELRDYWGVRTEDVLPEIDSD
jgi:hypothetical protein